MTLIQVIHILQQIALQQPNIRTATDGSIYEFLNANPSVEYDVFHVSQTTHRIEEDVDYYGFNLFYVSRLDATMENNRLTIQSVAKEALTNIVRSFCEEYAAIDELPILRFYPFTQRFNDECAGMYVQLEIGIPVDWVCEDDFGYVQEVTPTGNVKLQVKSITIKENGTQVVYPSEGYDGISKITIKTEVPPEYLPARLYDLTATTNSTYTPAAGFDGFGRVVVDVPQGSSAVLGNLSVNEEGEFHHTYNAQEQGLDGYSSVTINILNDCECEDCQPYYDDGYEDGVADQKAKLSSRNITKNGEYTNPDGGWSAITVNVAGDCSSAYTQGYNDAKAELSGLTATTNGSYIGEYSAVTVNVSSGAPEETTIITYKTINASKGIVPLDSRGKYYDQDGIERTVISHLFDSTTSTGTITISGKIAKIDGHMFIPHDNEQPLASDRWNIETVNLPNSITEIGEAVFNDCTQILYFNFPTNLKSIGKNAFSNCGRLRAIDIPSSCVSVGPWAFYNAGNGLTTKLYLRNGTRVLDISSFKVDSGRTGTYWDFGIKEIYFPEEASSDRSQFPYIYVNEDRPTSRVTPYTFSGVPTNGTIHLKSGSSRQLTEDWAMALPSWTVVYDL